MRWCCALQEALLRLDWPATLLGWAECAPASDAASGALLWRGLRVRMGMAFGRAEHRKPLNTGAAPCMRGCSSAASMCALTQACELAGQQLLDIVWPVHGRHGGEQARACTAGAAVCVRTLWNSMR